MVVVASRAEHCFICLNGNLHESFVSGPFCQNEGADVFENIGVRLDAINDTVSVGLRVNAFGRHGPVHSACLAKALSINNACPVCRLPNIAVALQRPRPVNASIQSLQRHGNLADTALTLARPDYRGANFAAAELPGVYLWRVDLRETNFTSANLRGAMLSDTDLRGASLAGADLDSANLQGSDLRGANLTATNFTNANVTFANLSSAILTDAHFIGADLTMANLSRATLTGTNLQENI